MSNTQSVKTKLTPEEKQAKKAQIIADIEAQHKKDFLEAAKNWNNRLIDVVEFYAARSIEGYEISSHTKGDTKLFYLSNRNSNYDNFLIRIVPIDFNDINEMNELQNKICEYFGKIEEEDRKNNVKKQALEKLSTEEKNLLGLN